MYVLPVHHITEMHFITTIYYLHSTLYSGRRPFTLLFLINIFSISWQQIHILHSFLKESLAI